jgi:hypothetical protein
MISERVLSAEFCILSSVIASDWNEDKLLLPAQIVLVASKIIVRNRTILTGTDNNFNTIFAVFLFDPEACKSNKIKVF